MLENDMNISEHAVVQKKIIVNYLILKKHEKKKAVQNLYMEKKQDVLLKLYHKKKNAKLCK